MKIKEKMRAEIYFYGKKIVKILALLLALATSTAHADAYINAAATSPSDGSNISAKALASSGLEVDYQKKLKQITQCGNRSYLSRVAINHRDACYQTATKLQSAIHKHGAECDHVIMVSSAIDGTDVSEIVCVVHGGDKIYGLVSNTVSYLIAPSGFIRLPADPNESREIVNTTVSNELNSHNATDHPVFFVTAWMWRHSPKQPHIVQVVQVESQQICDALVDGGGLTLSLSGHITKEFCTSKRPVMLPQWHCQTSIEPSGVSATYDCSPTEP